jgi:hypothetical protein
MISGHGIRYPNYIVPSEVLLHKQRKWSGNVEVADSLIGMAIK